jgi:hypothetical protein
MATFVPMQSIPMDREHMLDQSTGRFQTVKDGLPELIKNAKDQYSRLGILPKENRQIVILISSNAAQLGVLDFAGATTEDFGRWQVWSSPEASRAGMARDIEGAHGNGGKSFMVRGAVRGSYMLSCRNGRVSKMGFDNSRPYRPGRYATVNGQLMYNLQIDDPEAALNAELAAFNSSVRSLPPPARSALHSRNAFTIVRLDGVRDWTVRRSVTRETLIRHMAEDLRSHPQAALTIESCSVWIMRGASLATDNILQVQQPEPYPGFENLEKLQIPDELQDPDTDEPVATGPGEPERKYLEIKTSVQNLRLSDRTKARNVLRVRNERNIIANYSIADLVPTTASCFLYGTLSVPALTEEHSAGIERQHLVDTPLVRALRHWASEQLRIVADQIQESQTGRESPIERERANDTLSRFRELMRDFLNPQTPTGAEGESGPSERLRHESGSIVHEIVLESEHPTLKIASGTTVPLAYKMYEIRGEERLLVPRADLTLEAEPLGIVSMTGRASITGLRPGRSQIRLVSWENGVRSNPTTIEVVEVTGLQIEPQATPFKQGERRQMRIHATTINGSLDDLLYQASVDETLMGRIGRSGMFTAGRVPGQATIRIQYGADEDANNTALVQISEERLQRPGAHEGPDIPYLVLCGQPAPGYEHLAEDQRTHHGGPEFPTIIDQDPVWEKIVWINQFSKESEKARGRVRGGGPRGLNTKTFQQFLALKVFEILRRLKVLQEVGEDRITSVEFLRDMAQAEIDTADFLDAAYELIDLDRLSEVV